MPPRIEHIVRDGQELKWCSWCKEYRPLSEFHSTNGRTWDGLFWLCINHANEKRQQSRSYNAHNAWRNILKRVRENERYLSKGVEVKMTQTSFIEWYKENWFKGCRVDRIDNDGHYEIGNLQLISLTNHNHKAREDKLKSLGVVEPDGLRYCYKCGKFKKYDEFYRRAYKVSIKNPLGLNEACGECCREKRRERFELQREISS
jgi:hypothetical protein